MDDRIDAVNASRHDETRRSGLPSSISHQLKNRAQDSGFLRDRSTAPWAPVLAAALCLIGAYLGVAEAQTVTEFTLPTPNAAPLGITAGPDGNLWFTEAADSANKIGRITPAGVVTEFDIPSGGAESTVITAGPDGNLWFIESSYDGYNPKIGRIDPSTGVVTEFSGFRGLYGIAAGADGNLWFGQFDSLSSITPLGVVSNFSIPASFSPPVCITAGPDGNLWSTVGGQLVGTVYRITTAGVITVFFPNIASDGGFPCIATGPDGNLWFAENYGVDRIGRLTTAGVFTDFSAGITPGAFPYSITAGPDGNMWFTEYNANQIARITPTGVVSEFSAGITTGANPLGITAGPDGNIWFTEHNGNRIGRLNIAATPVTPTIDAPSLAPTPIGGLVFIPPHPIGSCVAGDRKLVLVTHGWQPSVDPLNPLNGFVIPMQTIAELSVTQMAVNIRRQIDQGFANDACNWDVYVFDWIASAWTSMPQEAFRHTEDVASQAYKEVKARETLNGEYKHVHLVAHSAGSKVVDVLAQTFKLQASPPTVQETFLDAYYPGGNHNTYGCMADWAESYVDMRPAAAPPGSIQMLLGPNAINGEDAILQDIYYTNLTLSGALNIDVTQLADPSWPPTSFEPGFTVDEMKADHEWPVTWYASTVAPASALYGWSLSLEAVHGTLPSYVAGAGRGDRVCLAASGGKYNCPGVGTPAFEAGPALLADSQCAVSMVPLNQPLLALMVTQQVSLTGTVSISPDLSTITLKTGSPAWLKATLNLPQAVDTLQFDALFTSTAGAAGYLTVFADGQLVYARQEVNVNVGAPTNISIPTGSLAAGPHWFGFRLDPTNAIQSEVQLSNVQVGSTGLTRAPLPVVQPKATGTQGSNGWYTSDVAVSWTVDGSGLPILSNAGCDPSTLSVDTSGQAFTCSATTAAGTGTGTVTVKRDTTPPVATATPSPPSNVNGWNNSAVTVKWSGTDATSGIAQCTADQTLNAEAAGQSASGTCTDNAGNVSAPVSAGGINIDKTAPIVAATANPPPGVSGWNNTPVIVTFTATDALSGIAASGCSPPVTLSTDGPGQSATGQCADKAGNSSSATVSGIKIDRTPPVAVASRTPAANANGWNNTNVTVSFAGTDSISGSGVASCSPSTVVSAEGARQSASGTCTDVAGNISAPAVAAGINIDKTSPTVSIISPPNGASYVSGSAVTASYSCADGLSGVASCTGSVVSGTAIDTTGSGAKTFTVNATDLAGNAASMSNGYTVTPATDTSPPVITPIVTGSLGDNGWYVSNVSVTWQVTDAQSAIKSTQGCGPSSVTSDTNGVTFTCKAMSSGGSSTNSVTIKRDDDPPVIGIVSPFQGLTYKRNQTVIAVYGCVDLRSGIAQCTGTLPNGSHVDTTSAGNKLFTVNGRDRAGNTRTSTVQYAVH
jgi:streptogramin lyase